VDNKIKILFLTILISCDHVGQQHFKSLNGWFELDYPGHWTQFDEEDGTYLFMDNEDWKGNLRITAMRVENDNEPGRIKRNLREQLEEKRGSKMISLGDMDAVYWTKEVEQDGDSLFVYNWTTGDNGTLLICSFVVDKHKIDQEDVREELEYAIRTLESIRVQ
jgi:Domain of unknown function (DUF3805)